MMGRLSFKFRISSRKGEEWAILARREEEGQGEEETEAAGESEQTTLPLGNNILEREGTREER